MTYKETIKREMENLAKDDRVVFIGYNVGCGSKGGGTFENIPEPQLIEMPLAESLMMGCAVGMALESYKPVVYFERMDFITNALDVIVNQLDKLNELSQSEFNPQVIMRCVVGNMLNPLYTGITHTQNLSNGVRGMVDFPVIELDDKEQIHESYFYFGTKMIVEFKDFYNE